MSSSRMKLPSSWLQLKSLIDPLELYHRLYQRPSIHWNCIAGAPFRREDHRRWSFLMALWMQIFWLKISSEILCFLFFAQLFQMVTDSNRTTTLSTTSKRAKQFMEGNRINWWKEWPSESPDLNPIDMVWKQMKSYVGAEGHKDQRGAYKMDPYLLGNEDDSRSMYTVHWAHLKSSSCLHLPK